MHVVQPRSQGPTSLLRNEYSRELLTGGVRRLEAIDCGTDWIASTSLLRDRMVVDWHGCGQARAIGMKCILIGTETAAVQIAIH